ncbi:MAG: FGGY-family carbohydrate kinase [Candidatus Pelethousia sp.]|nr:FGGY-family carbohydrate kinase [Candidatus Pelethousia sp.]
MNYYIGLDNGGTTTKAALYTATGEEVGVASANTQTESLHPDWAERDMEEMWAANCAVLRDLLQKTGVAAEDIRCLAVCGHGKGLYLWGKDGRPARKGIGSTDNRAWEYPLQWEKDGTAAKVFQLSCQHIMPCQPVALLAWLRDHEPQTLQSVQWVFSCKDYVRFRLTGEAYGEYSDYSGSNLLNLYTRQYDRDLLSLFGIEDMLPALPPLREAMEVCGSISEEAAARTGLRAGTPVAGGLFDIDACALAVGITDETNICMIAGTWSINEYIRKTPVTDGTAWMNSLFALKEYYLIEECSPTSAGNQEWILKTLFPEMLAQAAETGRNVYDAINRQIDAIPAEAFCPLFLPFILGTNVHPNAKGSFIGIGANHTRAHILRAVYEGVCFSHKYHLNKLLKTRADMPKGIRLSGGVAKSAVWTQMFADIMELPVETVSAKEAGALGSAMCAAVACGDQPSIERAIAAMTKVSAAVLPNPARAEAYRKKYALYLQAIEGLNGLWDAVQRMQ